MRPETGSMQFGDDWPGVFIRGDEALFYETIIRKACDTDIEVLSEYHLRALAGILVSCHQQSICVFEAPQRMKEYWTCVLGPCGACTHYEKEKFSPKILDYVTACNNPDSPRYRQQVRHDDGCGEWERS